MAGAVLSRDRRATVTTLGGALLIAALAWFFGADVWHAILVGALATTLLWIGDLVASAPDDADDWPDEDRGRPGRRGDIVDIARSLTVGRGRVGGVAMGRVRGLAQRRLATRGLDLGADEQRGAIERLIGCAAYATLMRDRPSRRALVDCLDALDLIGPGAGGAITTPTDPGALT